MTMPDIISNDDHGDFVAKTRQCFDRVGLKSPSPEFTRVESLYKGERGRHTGIYFIFQRTPEGYIYYYTGIATKGNTIHKRFQPHYAKLTVNLRTMYGALDRERRETQYQFPRNWRQGVKQHFLNNPDDIPDYWQGRQRREVIQPKNLDWRPEFKVNVNLLPVMIFDLTGVEAAVIDSLETEFIRQFRPVFNGSKTRI